MSLDYEKIGCFGVFLYASALASTGIDEYLLLSIFCLVFATFLAIVGMVYR
jgi:hypothetical protein